MRKNPAVKVAFLVMGGAVLVAAGSVGAQQILRRTQDKTINPVTGWMAGVGRGISQWVEAWGGVGRLSDENAGLRQEVAALREELSRTAELRTQNEALRREINLNQDRRLSLLAADVIAYQPDNFRSVITINRGSREGLRAGLAVIAEGQLVGKITETSTDSAKVLLVGDPTFRVNGLDQQTRASGTVRGQIGSGLIMDKIAQSDALQPGDTIVTSGLGGELPKGLVIGRVKSVDRRETAVFQTALITSDVKINRLEIVFVVML